MKGYSFKTQGFWDKKFSLVLLALIALTGVHLSQPYRKGIRSSRPTFTQAHREQVSAQCKNIHASAGPPPTFLSSSRIAVGSDRYVPGTPPTLLRNAKIWTGARNGTEIVFGDVLLDKGLVVAIGHIPREQLIKAQVTGDLKVLDVEGKWITPGLVDLHSHIGTGSAPHLNGASDGNSHSGPILPWLRSVDGINTHDQSYELSISGGVTTAQVLPGSANNIGGQAFVIKLRSTAERSTTSKVVEPPAALFATPNGTDYIHWRHMKHACGENPSRTYSQTRMDSGWAFRNAYNEARKVKDAQDAFCEKVEAGRWNELDNAKFPESFQWESLVDVLRGRVKLSIHCYEAVDLDMIVRLSNEFKFPVASFHHAGETYLVPDLLKNTWGGVPSIALFASNFRKKREAYRGSEFAPRVLAEHGIPVVMKSDHPVLDSRFLLFEAQLAHHYGLEPALALASVTSTPARAAGLGHRVGALSEGYDADLIIWDSHPLTLGATPMQVFIDGIPQLKNSHASLKPKELQEIPKQPDFDREAEDTVKFGGLPPLTVAKKLGKQQTVVFHRVKSVWTRPTSGQVEAMFDNDGSDKTVVVRDGVIECVSESPTTCAGSDASENESVVVDLQGGSLAPGLTTFGSPIGLVEIRLEASTNDGIVIDPLTNGRVPPIIGGDGAIIRAVDGLQFEGRNTLLAYHGGVTQAITAPSSNGFLSGLSTAFFVGASHALSADAIIEEEVALHITISYGMGVSVSTQIATLRNLLFGSQEGAWALVREGQLTLVISVESADIMSTLLLLKHEYETESGQQLQLTFSGATEAYLLASEIGEAGVSVILTSPRPYPGTWERRRILPGPPLTQDTGITVLLSKGVNVAIGVVDEFAARNTRFEAGWAALASNGKISKVEAISLATSNLERALGARKHAAVIPDLVVYRGGSLFDFDSKTVGVISAQRQSVEFF